MGSERAEISGDNGKTVKRKASNKRKADPNSSAFPLETIDKPEGREFESLTACHPENLVYQGFRGFSYALAPCPEIGCF